MTDAAISPLRRRMIEDMTIRRLAPKTQQGYMRTVKDFAAFLGRSPDTASFEDVRRFQLHLAASGVRVPVLNHTVSALRFFFRVTLSWTLAIFQLRRLSGMDPEVRLVGDVGEGLVERHGDDAERA
jgi:Phage integrase, N-terminal SAM-like domain